MRKVIYTLSSVGIAVLFSGCQNEILNSMNQNPQVESSYENNGAFARQGSNYFESAVSIAQSLEDAGFGSETEVTQLLIDTSLSGYDYSNKEIITPQFINNIVAAGSFVEENGIESFCTSLNYSNSFATQVGKIAKGDDISLFLESIEFQNLSSSERELLNNLVLFQKDSEQFKTTNNSSSRLRPIDNTAIGFGFMYGLFGALLGAGFGGAGAVIGFVVGAAIGVLVSTLK